MLTLNQIKSFLQSKQENHAQLSNGTFLFDEQAEFGADAEIQYPLMGVTVLPASLNGNTHTFNFEFVFVDHVHQDNSNKDEVMSDMHSIALDIYSKIKYDLETQYNHNASINLTANFEPVVGVFDDDVSGWSFSIALEQFYDRSTCDTPDSGAESGLVYIKDQDGNTIATLNPGSTYTVTIVSAINGGNATTIFTNTVIGN